jgi:hypothetical protein
MTLNHAQRRVSRPRIGVTARGVDFQEDGRLSVCPATGAVRLRANFEEDAFETSNAGVYQKLAEADWDFTNLNASGEFQDAALASTGLRYVRFFGENTAGVAGVTKAAYSADQGWAIGVFAYGAGAEQAGQLIEMGWNSTPSGAVSGPSFRFYLDGRVEMWHDGVRQASGSLSGTAGFGRSSLEFVLITIERGRGRDVIVRTSKSGAVAFRADWVDADDPLSVMFPAGKFWWAIDRGGAMVMACPIVYQTTAYAETRTYVMAEAPGVGETLEDFTGSDRFTALNDAHLIGHPQGGSATVSLRKVDGTAFVPDGIERSCRVRLALTSGDAGIRSPWVWGVHLAYPCIVELTDDDPVVINSVLGGPVRLELPDGPEGLSATFDVRNPEALEALAPGASVQEGTPIKIELWDPDEVDDPIILLDGELVPPEMTDAHVREGSRLSFRAIDRLRAAWNDKAREALPVDGMPMCRPVGSGISAVLLFLRQTGCDDGAVLPDLDWTLPDVPGSGRESLPSGEFNLSVASGNTWGDMLERLFSRAPLVVWGMRPTGLDAYGFKAVEVSDSDVPIATVYRSVADAQAADPGLSDREAERLLYDELRTIPLPLEGNDVRVTGYDPGKQAPIAAHAVWAESVDPTVAVADRFRGWLGRHRSVEYGDPALTTLDDCQRVCEGLFEQVAAARDLDSLQACLPVDSNGVPIWRGELLTIDDHQDSGDARDSRTSAWSVDLYDESGMGYMAGQEQPPYRPCRWSGGALLGYGGVAAWQITSLAQDRARSAQRYKGFGSVLGVSLVAAVELP